MFKTATTAALAAILLSSVTAMAADPAVKCESGKLKVSSKYAACRLKADAKAVAKGEAADYAKCELKFADKWAKTEAKAGAGICPSEGDQTAIQDFIDACDGSVADALSGGALLLDPVTCDAALDACDAASVTCGNGLIDGVEVCDFGNLNGETCSNQTGAAKPYGTLHCAAGCASFHTSGCKPRYEQRYWKASPPDDDKTVFDNQTGLEWVVTDDAGGLTDKDNIYTWSTGDNSFNGTAKTVYIDGLNAANYAGHNDWRLPSVDDGGDADELETIVDLTAVGCGSAPCIDQAVFGPTQSGGYWSSSTIQGTPTGAWGVYFNGGGTGAGNKMGGSYVRAVRAGS